MTKLIDYSSIGILLRYDRDTIQEMLMGEIKSAIMGLLLKVDQLKGCNTWQSPGAQETLLALDKREITIV